MPNFNYLVSYAGVPLLTDQAKIVKLDFSKSEAQPSSIIKNQPSVDLIEELNKLIANNKYLQDFALPTDYPGKTLGAIARPTPPETHPISYNLKIGDFYYPATASRWSVYRGLASSSIVKAILDQLSIPESDDPNPVQWTAAPFIMQAAAISPNNPQGTTDHYTVQTNMFMLPPRPLAEHGGRFDGLYLITLVDERYYWQFRTISLQIDQQTPWDMLIFQIANALNLTINDNQVDLFWDTIPAVYGYAEPDSQLWTSNSNAAQLFDAVAANIGCTLVRNLNGTYGLVPPVFSQQILQANLLGMAANLDPATVLSMTSGQTGYPTNPHPARLAGGDLFYSGGANLPVGDLSVGRNAVVPTNGVNVAFPMYITGDDPVPHFVNFRYTNQRPTTWYEDSFGGMYVINVPLSSGGGISGGGFRPEDLVLTSGGVFASGVDLNSVSGLVGAANLTHTITSTAKALFAAEGDL